eukprot:PhM_4_TR6290/c0_g1_i1/m.41957
MAGIESSYTPRPPTASAKTTHNNNSNSKNDHQTDARPPSYPHPHQRTSPRKPPTPSTTTARRNQKHFYTVDKKRSDFVATPTRNDSRHIPVPPPPQQQPANDFMGVYMPMHQRAGGSNSPTRQQGQRPRPLTAMTTRSIHNALIMGISGAPPDVARGAVLVDRDASVASNVRIAALMALELQHARLGSHVSVVNHHQSDAPAKEDVLTAVTYMRRRHKEVEQKSAAFRLLAAVFFGYTSRVRVRRIHLASMTIAGCLALLQRTGRGLCVRCRVAEQRDALRRAVVLTACLCIQRFVRVTFARRSKTARAAAVGNWLDTMELSYVCSIQMCGRAALARWDLPRLKKLLMAERTEKRRATKVLCTHMCGYLQRLRLSAVMHRREASKGSMKELICSVVCGYRARREACARYSHMARRLYGLRKIVLAKNELRRRKAALEIYWRRCEVIAERKEANAAAEAAVRIQSAIRCVLMRWSVQRRRRMVECSIDRRVAAEAREHAVYVSLEGVDPSSETYRKNPLVVVQRAVRHHLAARRLERHRAAYREDALMSRSLDAAVLVQTLWRRYGAMQFVMSRQCQLQEVLDQRIQHEKVTEKEVEGMGGAGDEKEKDNEEKTQQKGPEEESNGESLS